MEENQNQHQENSEEIKNQLATQFDKQLPNLPAEQRKAVEEIAGSLIEETLKSVSDGEVKMTGNFLFDSLKLLKHVGKKAYAIQEKLAAIEANNQNKSLNDGGANQSTETGPVQPTTE